MTSLVPGGAILKDQNSPRQLRPTEVKRLNREWRGGRGGAARPLLVFVRSAAAFRADQLWLCGNTAPLSHPGVGKTALGTQRLVQATQEPSPVAAAKAAAAPGLRGGAGELGAGGGPLHAGP